MTRLKPILAVALGTTLALPMTGVAEEPRDGNRFDRRGERVEEAFDHRDARTERRYDRAIEAAEARGRDGVADHLETRAGHVDAARDRREDRVLDRLDRRSDRLDGARGR